MFCFIDSYRNQIAAIMLVATAILCVQVPTTAYSATDGSASTYTLSVGTVPMVGSVDQSSPKSPDHTQKYESLPGDTSGRLVPTLTSNVAMTSGCHPEIAAQHTRKLIYPHHTHI